MSNALVVSQIATFEGAGWRAVTLREKHTELLARLFEESDDYFELVQGAPPGAAEVQSAFSSLPEGKTYEDKFVFVILDDQDDVVGQLEVIRDYPSEGQWWIGVLLLAPDRRRSGLGADVHRSCVEWAREQGAEAMQLSVVEENVDALRFWSRLGYEETERKGPRRIGSKDHWLIVLRKAI